MDCRSIRINKVPNCGEPDKICHGLKESENEAAFEWEDSLLLRGKEACQVWIDKHAL